MAEENWFKRRFEVLKWLGLFALVGAALLIAGVALGQKEGLLVVAGIVAVIPAFVYCFVLPILHWKERYVGQHSDLWGVLLLLEVSSWSKLVYWFRHILSDYQGNGRYRRSPAAAGHGSSPAA